MGEKQAEIAMYPLKLQMDTRKSGLTDFRFCKKRRKIVYKSLTKQYDISLFA